MVQTIIIHGHDRALNGPRPHIFNVVGAGVKDTPEDKASVLCGDAEEYVPENQARKDSVAVKAPSGAAAAEDAAAAEETYLMKPARVRRRAAAGAPARARRDAVRAAARLASAAPTATDKTSKGRSGF